MITLHEIRFYIRVTSYSECDIMLLYIYCGLGCGARFTTDNGVLISPNYPNPYPHNAQCVWTISVPSGEVITFTITNIDLEVHRNCMWDYVEVRACGFVFWFQFHFLTSI